MDSSLTSYIMNIAGFVAGVLVTIVILMLIRFYDFTHFSGFPIVSNIKGFKIVRTKEVREENGVKTTIITEKKVDVSDRDQRTSVILFSVMMACFTFIFTIAWIFK